MFLDSGKAEKFQVDVERKHSNSTLKGLKSNLESNWEVGQCKPLCHHIALLNAAHISHICCNVIINSLTFFCQFAAFEMHSQWQISESCGESL